MTFVEPEVAGLGFRAWIDPNSAAERWHFPMAGHPSVAVVLPGPIPGDPNVLGGRTVRNGLGGRRRGRGRYQDVAIHCARHDCGRNDGRLRLRDNDNLCWGGRHARRGRRRRGDEMGFCFRGTAGQETERAAQGEEGANLGSVPVVVKS